MKITVDITSNNYRVLKRQLDEYNTFKGTDLNMDQFKEIVFINGLLSFSNGIDVRAKRSGYPFNDVVNGEIIEYR